MKKTKNFRDVIAKSPCVFVIGVAGDSGSGKTTFTSAVREIFGENLVSTITLDDYHTLDREERKERNVTPLSPEANNFELLREHVSMLKRGLPIQKPVYNHKNGRFDPPVPFSPKKIIILEGLHPFATEELRSLMDFTVFVNPDKDVKYDWKIRRDVGERGYKKEDVMAELKARSVDYELYVKPQIEYSDAVIRISNSRYGKRVQNMRNVYNVTLYQNRLDKTIKNINLNFNLFSINSLADRNFLFEFHRTNTDKRRLGALSLDGEFSFDVIRSLEKNIEKQTGVTPVSLYSGKEYVTATEMVQLLLSWRIINKRIAIEEESGDGFCV
ncbi:phosphoribulokinase [Methanoplanus sp. FWC-SCC4]|uniref:phosphoribulokinase n=1 Tax=Methanochimaera problematica TaxID=2609417 RepID=A0AA97I2S7_9EURY|nr:phosphoribulokinase [Methanoplanus sp. FWC-SCC4]WOF16605.1 phosphoribulokinase [Methanoplanus sp. FWC-SCC4]